MTDSQKWLTWRRCFLRPSHFRLAAEPILTHVNPNGFVEIGMLDVELGKLPELKPG
ncbi:MAG: hypothetical protein K2X93_10300 [Candidatus Obscuribacterales bacterium]|nr:hypothetical protein [Candidatus Obscuribacterales bacterium]